MFVDEAAEYRLLGAVVDDPDLVLRLTPNLFTGDRTAVFTAMRGAYMRYGDMSSEAVENLFGKAIPNAVEAARGAKPAAILDRLKALALKRELAHITNRINVALTNNELTYEEAIKLLALSPIMATDDSSLIPGVTEFVSELQRKKNGQYKFVSTGLAFLDHMLGGEWPRQALTVVIGQAGGGKTALVCQSALNMAMQGIPTTIVSLEMPKSRIISRMVSNLTEIDGMRIRSGRVTDEEIPRIDAALAQIQSLPIYIIDRRDMSASEIAAQIKMHRELYGIEAFFVDYLQIIRRDTESDMLSEELGAQAQLMRNVASELDISAILLSQQNRGHQGLASILGSGRISHIADSVFEINLEGNTDAHRLCSFIFHKNRDGAVGTSTCYYRPSCLKFV